MQLFLICLFLQMLYMFQAVPPPIFRSSKTVYTASGIVNQYNCWLLAWLRWNFVHRIANIFPNYNQKMQHFLICVFLQMLYMFQAVPPPIFRSSKTVYIASGIVNQYCC